MVGVTPPAAAPWGPDVVVGAVVDVEATAEVVELDCMSVEGVEPHAVSNKAVQQMIQRRTLGVASRNG